MNFFHCDDRAAFRSIVLASLGGLLVSLDAHCQVELRGIECNLTPRAPASAFVLPVDHSSTEWRWDHNEFANVISNKLPGFQNFDAGLWQHTGVDFSRVGGSSGQQIRAIAPGIVVFSTASAGQKAVHPVTQRDMTLTRGGLVIVAHEAPQGKLFHLPAWARKGEGEATLPSLRLKHLYSYYLHLDPRRIEVKVGDQVTAGEELGRLYDAGSGFAYAPHLHFELWSACADVERNGYDRAGAEFSGALDDPLIDPSVVWRGLALVRDSAQPPYSSVAGFLEVTSPRLNPGLLKALQRTHPGGEIPRWMDRSEYRICFRGTHSSPSASTHPYLVSGDFDNDGRPDYAVSVAKPADDRRQLAVIAVLASGKVHVLNDQFSALPEEDVGLLIGMTSKGTTIRNRNGDPELLATDAVDLILCEKSSRSYVYDSRVLSFREVFRAD